MTGQIDRRTFLRRMGAGGGGLLLAAWLTACTEEDGAEVTAAVPSTTTPFDVPTTGATPTTVLTADPAATFAPDLMLEIAGDETVTITIPKSEMGQGVRTALAMLVAEELDADWSQVQVETAGADQRLGDQVTGGSLSISTRYDSMRRVGAAARSMLVAAAATLWGIDTTDCATEPGVVVERGGNRRASYGALAAYAADVEPPSAVDVTLKDPSDHRIIGQPLTGIDARRIVTGAAVYGSDVVLPDMAHAVIARSPVFGGTLTSWDGAAARATPGVADVIEVRSGVAVIADNTWAALRARDLLMLEWDPRGNESLDDATIERDLESQLDELDLADGEITAVYSHPFLPHSAMETLTAVASASPTGCEVWAGTQDPGLAKAVAGRGSNLPADQVVISIPLIGGGFGRRLEQDFVEAAAEVSAAFGGPVKLFWSRSDDIRHDRYHPRGMTRVAGDPRDPSTLRLQTALARSGPVPTGDWRSVTNAPEAFARECFIDELAHAAGADPYEYRRPMLDERDLATLDAAAAASAWGEALPAGRGRGMAHHSTWGVTPTSVVADVSAEGGEIVVERVVCAIDCGTIVNPDSVVAQVEGAVAFGVTAALLGGITVDGGHVVEANFDESHILRFDRMPEVEVILMPSNAAPSGVGEAGVPPTIPAVANALFAATGVRSRDLPLTLA